MVGTRIKLHSYIEYPCVIKIYARFDENNSVQKLVSFCSVKKTAHEMELKSVQTTATNR